MRSSRLGSGARRPARRSARDVRPGRARAGCRSCGAASGGGDRRASCAGDDELQLARVVAPGGEQAVGRRARGWGRPRGGRSAACRVAGDPVPQRRRRVQQEQVDVAVRRRARAGRASWPAGSRVSPKSDEPRRAGRRAPGRRAGARTRVEPLGRVGLADPRAQPAPQLGLPARLRERRAVVARAPTRGPSPAGAARSGRTGRRGGGRLAKRRRRAGRRRRRRAEVGGEACAATARRRRRVDDLEQRPHRRSGSHGSRVGSIPDAAATASPTAGAGTGSRRSRTRRRRGPASRRAPRRAAA